MSFEAIECLTSPTGAMLALRVNAPHRPRAVVQINHGLSEHSGRYAWFADRLAEAGYAAYAHDHRGHGETRAPDAPAGRFAQADGGQKVLDDAAFVAETIAAKHPGVPIIVFGHSMGGVIALNLAMRNPGQYAGAAIWNAATQGGLNARLAKLILRWERFRLGSDMPSRLLPRLTFQAWSKAMPERRTDFDWLSRDRSEVDRYIADPLCGRDPSVSLWIDLFELIFAAADDNRLAQIRRDLPISLVAGEKDPATHGGGDIINLQARLERLQFKNVAAKVHQDTRHESLKELNREEVLADFFAWLSLIG